MKKKSGLILLILGILLTVSAVVGVVIWQVGIHRAAADCEKTLEQIRALTPQSRPGVADDRVNTAMPMLEIDGENYVGIIEVPKFGTALPIAAQWNANRIGRHPCRYTGSIYDGSLIIGGSDNAGQFDFMKLISGGDAVYVTDVTGGRYAYVVTEIHKTDRVSASELSTQTADLVFYARNTYSLDYTIVQCKLGSK